MRALVPVGAAFLLSFSNFFWPGLGFHRSLWWYWGRHDNIIILTWWLLKLISLHKQSTQLLCLSKGIVGVYGRRLTLILALLSEIPIILYRAICHPCYLTFMLVFYVAEAYPWPYSTERQVQDDELVLVPRDNSISQYLMILMLDC